MMCHPNVAVLNRIAKLVSQNEVTGEGRSDQRAVRNLEPNEFSSEASEGKSYPGWPVLKRMAKKNQ